MIDVIAGVFVEDPDRWAKDGIEKGDFIASTNKTGGIDSPEKIHAALAAPTGTELIVLRGRERLKVALGKGIIQREAR